MTDRDSGLFDSCPPGAHKSKLLDASEAAA